MSAPQIIAKLISCVVIIIFLSFLLCKDTTFYETMQENGDKKNLKIFYMVTISYFFARFKQIIINLFGLYCKNLYLCTRKMMVRHDKWLPHFSFIVSYYFKSYVNINSFKFII